MQALSSVQWNDVLSSGDRIFIGSNAAVPTQLVDNLIENSTPLADLELVHILTMGTPAWSHSKNRSLFKINSLFLGEGVREEVAAGFADYTPSSLSEIPQLFNEGILRLNAALIMVSPPDKFGYCSLGVSVDVVKSAVHAAKVVVAQINGKMPVTLGQSFIHQDEIDYFLDCDAPIQSPPPTQIDPVSEQIGQYVSLLIEDGDTLQMGTGTIPDAIARYLSQHKHLGVHTQVFTDSLMDLINTGVIDNSQKSFKKGKVITSYALGSDKLYDYVDRNPHIEFHPSEFVNSPVNIAKNDHLVAISGALEIDVTGQVVADSIGYHFYSGIGGQVDFIRGASMSVGGKPIIAMHSTAKNDSISRICASLSEGSGVVTSRGDVHFVVTEYGIAALRGKSIRERALELIKIAHPKFREELLAQVRTHMRVPNYLTHSPGLIPELGRLSDVKITLKNKPYILRPLGPADESNLQRFFYSHNKETLLMRYNYRPTRMSRETSASLVNVDQTKDVALCIVDGVGPKQALMAVGRYYYIAQKNVGEVAFVVSEKQRGKGMAPTLLKWLIKIAKDRGLSAMVAYTRSDNQVMQNIFTGFGFKKSNQGLDEVHFELLLKDSQ